MPADAAVQRQAVRPAAKILRAVELERWLQGDAALERAGAEAAATIASAGLAYEAERRRGLEEGRAAASAELARALADAHATLQATLGEVEEALPALVSSVVEDIIGSFDADTLMQRALRRALGRLRRGADAVLRVAPACAEASRETLRELGFEAGIRLEADPSLPPERCVFESSLGKAELGVETQLRILRETLTQGWRNAA